MIKEFFKWLKEVWWIILIMFIILFLIFYFSGAYDCWTGGDCPPVSNITGLIEG